MRRWVLLGVVALGALAFLLIRQLGPSDAVTEPVKPAAAYAAAKLPPPPEFPEPGVPTMEELDEREPPAPGEPVKKLDPKGQEFFLTFDEMIAPRLTKEAADCYKGGLHRDLKIKFGFVSHIRDGRVTIRDVKILEDNLGDAALSRCMLEKVSNFASWKDDAFPDWEQEDEVLIRIRSLKKYQQEEDREYFPPTKVD
ncbi:MAG: hypothetical protein R3B48_01755 [Kofleriaceae bacterium]